MKIKLAFLLSLLALLAPLALRADQGEKAGRSPVILAEVNNQGDVRLLAASPRRRRRGHPHEKDNDEPDGEMCSSIVPAAYLEALAATLSEEGAMHLRDVEPVPGFTRKTVSFFVSPGSSGLTLGNTFSYSRAEGSYLNIARAINALIADQFGKSC